MINNKRISIAARALAIAVVAALVLAGTAMGEVTRTGLVGEWHFDGDAKDSSGNGNDGTIYGATFVDGKFGKALSFDGVNNYVSIADPASGALDFGATDSFTVELFVKYDVLGDRGPTFLLSKGYGSDADYYHAIDWTHIAFGITDGTNQVETQFPHSGLSTGKWYHVVGVRDVKTDRVDLYLDGVLVATSVDHTTSTLASPITLYIGKKPSGYYFDGSIDKVRIYNRALSAEEIKANYEAPKAPPQPSLTLTKSLSPSTITEGDSTTVTIRVENTGGDAKSVKIIDAIPQGFTLVSGSASQEYATLKATESRTFQYTVKATGTGRFVSDLATVTYQDEKGNSYSGASNSATITVQAGQAGQVPAAQPKTPGFGAIIAGIGIILALALRRR